MSAGTEMSGSTFFDEHQRATVAAAMARIIPSDETPGATEAGTIDFLDQYLSGTGYVYAKPDGSGFEELRGKQLEAWTKRIGLLQERYVEGIEALDRTANEEGGADFVALGPEQQDHVLTVFETPRSRAETVADTSRMSLYGPPTEPALQQTNAEIGLSFMALLCLHTRQGFYSDPVYGGNREQVGWKNIGFAGPPNLAVTQTADYSTLDYFAENRQHPIPEENHGA
ncbi:gluconate 2-dehydrogenase subunit 3 family protein [Pedococcus sp. NPDC057267]|uniref:gluconate 2-dehydrogenase subunit 3 family protein n=1 Tax=Pedococcus sp. NPDC057267 TaxID=3346077 RepID=UPI0036308F66